MSEVQTLIDRGVRLNSPFMTIPETPFTYPLHYSIWMHTQNGTFNEDILKLLIKNGANLEALDGTGATPL